MDITFTVYGVPIAQPRIRAMGRLSKSGKPFAHVYEPGKKDSPARQWKSDIRISAKRELMHTGSSKLLDGPISLTATFYLPRPKELYKSKYESKSLPHTKRPDIENLLKLLMDALTGVLICDDKQIFFGNASKWYHESDAGPRVLVTVAEPVVVDSMVQVPVDTTH